MRKLILALFMLGAFGAAQAGKGPGEVIKHTTETLFNKIEENRAEYQENPEALELAVREVLVPRLDQLFAGRLVLGRHSRGLEPEKVQEFAEALSSLLIEKYAEQLLEFKSRDQLEILPLQGELDEDKTRVQTRVKLDSGQSVPVDYIMHKTDAGWQVFDVVVEGVSYVVTFRTQFNEEIQQDGFETVLERVRSGQIEIAEGE